MSSAALPRRRPLFLAGTPVTFRALGQCPEDFYSFAPKSERVGHCVPLGRSSSIQRLITQHTILLYASDVIPTSHPYLSFLFFTITNPPSPTSPLSTRSLLFSASQLAPGILPVDLDFHQSPKRTRVKKFGKFLSSPLPARPLCNPLDPAPTTTSPLPRLRHPCTRSIIQRSIKAIQRQLRVDSPSLLDYRTFLTYCHKISLLDPTTLNLNLF